MARARGVVSKGCHYGLGHGGMFPERTYPWDDEHFLDCSGFVSWALGRSRKNSSPRYMNFNGGWFETTAATLLNLELAGATTIDGGLTYIEV